MKRLWILLILILVVSGCKDETPVKPSGNTQTQNNSPAIPIVGDTIGIKLDSCVKVLDTLTMDTLTICWDSVMDRRLLYPYCQTSIPPAYAKIYYTLNGNINFALGIDDCLPRTRGCEDRVHSPLDKDSLLASIDTLGYEICLTYFFPFEDTFSQPGIPDSAYFSKLYIHKK